MYSIYTYIHILYIIANTNLIKDAMESSKASNYGLFILITLDSYIGNIIFVYYLYIHILYIIGNTNLINDAVETIYSSNHGSLILT